MEDFNRLEDFFKKMRYLVDSLNEEDLGLVLNLPLDMPSVMMIRDFPKTKIS